MCRLTVIFLLLLTTAGGGQAQTVLFDSNGFESGLYSSGSLNGQNNWFVLNSSTQFQVQSTLAAGGAGQAVRAFGSASFNQAAQVLNYTPAAGELVRVQADVARTVGPMSSSTSQSYGILLNSAATFTRVTEFGLANAGGSTIRPYVSAPFNLATGQFDPAQPVRTVFVGGTVPANTFVSFDARLDYQAKTLRLFLNGTDYGQDIPFADPTATTLFDANLLSQSSSTSLDIGFWDNYRVTVVPVPEPSLTLAVVAGGLVAARGARRLTWA